MNVDENVAHGSKIIYAKRTNSNNTYTKTCMHEVTHTKTYA